MKNCKYYLLIILLQFIVAQANAENVQWASELIGFSSQMDSVRGSARQALGKPSVMSEFGMSPCAWASKEVASPEGEWIKVGFAEPMKIAQIAINQNFNPGAISKVWIYDENDNEYLVYNNANPEVTSVNGKMLHVFMPLTKYNVQAVKIFLKTDVFADWNQIDAIAISDSKKPVYPSVNLPLQTRERYFVENLGDNVNSPAAELVPVISPDGQTLYFTRNNHPGNTGEAKKLDVWQSKMNKDGSFAPAENLGKPINNEFSNFLFSISPDNNTLYLGNQYMPDGQMDKGISKSSWDGEKWDLPQNMEIKDFTNLRGFANYFMAPSGQELYLSVEMEDSYGGMDIYVSFLQSDGSWSKPKNLGPTINTASDDISPFIAADEKTLYYSTDGLPSLGSNDIFYSQRLDTTWTIWSEPVNLGQPVNSSGWEAYWSVPAQGDYGYYVTNHNSSGNEDIYRIRLAASQRPGTVKLVYGRVIDSKTSNPVQAQIIYETLPSGIEAGTASSNPKTGEYKIILPAGAKYGFLAQADNYLSINEYLDLRQESDFTEINRDLYLVPIEKGQVVRINNIFFEFAKYDILEDSFSELNRIVKFLQENPKIRIRINGHTDNIGSMQDNLELSRRRAGAVADYLNIKGIDKKRVETKGFGFSKPIVDNDTEEGRAKNRRVEFEIIGN